VGSGSQKGGASAELGATSGRTVVSNGIADDGGSASVLGLPSIAESSGAGSWPTGR
jgi:hypothetical protein